MKHNIEIRYKNLKLRQIENQDIEKLRNWRNDSEKSRFLRKIGYITPEMQQNWFNKYLDNENELSFVVEEMNDLNCVIGSLSLYDFKENQVEIGKILIGDERVKGFGYGRISFVMLMKYAFEILKVQKVIATVNINNIPARKSYFRIGFEITGQKYIENAGTEDVIEIDKETLIKNNDIYNDIEIIV